MTTDFSVLSNKACKYILAIVNNRSITAAAKTLYISQPALTKYIKVIEGNLGFPLFIHIGHKLELTWQCERILDYARHIAQLEDKLMMEMTDWRDAQRGRIRIALPKLRSPFLLPKIIPQFRQLYPNVDIELHEMHAKYLEELLYSGEADFVILNTPPKRADTVSEFIRYDEMFLATPSTHPFALDPIKQKGLSKQDIYTLQNEEFILQPTEQRTRQIANYIFDSIKLEPRVMLVTSSIQTAVNLVAQGCGLCFVAETYCKQFNFPVEPCYFPLKFEYPRIQINIAYLKNTYVTDYFKTFLSIVRENL